MNSTLIEIRLVHDDNAEMPWENLPVCAYMPLFLTGVGARDNIERRVQSTYFRHDPRLKRVHCCPKGHPKEGFWVEKEI